MSKPTIVSRIDNLGEPAIASWGEQAVTRILRMDGKNNFFVIDYHASAGFGVPRHLHHEQDEVLQILGGSVAVWTPEWSGILKESDIVSLPVGVPHEWRCLSNQAGHFTMTLTPGGPGGLKDFWHTIPQRGLTLADVPAVAVAAEACGMRITAPRFTEAEVQGHAR